MGASAFVGLVRCLADRQTLDAVRSAGQRGPHRVHDRLRVEEPFESRGLFEQRQPVHADPVLDDVAVLEHQTRRGTDRAEDAESGPAQVCQTGAGGGGPERIDVDARVAPTSGWT